MRKKFIIGNWKMNLNLASSQDLITNLKNHLKGNTSIDVAVCPPFVYLNELTNLLKGSNIQIGAQNMFQKEDGAYTGEISPKMLKDLKIKLVIIGHSERRQHFYETDNDVNLKIKSALKHELIPIFCVGEDLSTREKGQALSWVEKQVEAGLKDLNEDAIEKIIIAYEPIWAIGTGKICSGEEANKVIKMIRETIKKASSQTVSEKLRILYGGSIKSDNFEDHIKYKDIDGGLVGGSSLKFDEFAKIIDLADTSRAQHHSQRL